MIPMVADGLKPFTVYAADADRTKAAKMPVVAIVVGGLGVGAAKTADAIMKTHVFRAGVAFAAPCLFVDPKTHDYLGASVDVAQAIARSLDVKAEYVPSNWDVIIAALQSNKFEAIVAPLRPGAFLGQGALARHPVSLETATATIDSTVLVVAKRQMIRLLHNQHELFDLAALDFAIFGVVIAARQQFDDRGQARPAMRLAHDFVRNQAVFKGPASPHARDGGRGVN